MPMTHRRSLLLGSLAAPLLAAPAIAQAWAPTRTVRILFILPVPALVLAWITLAVTLLTPLFYGPESLDYLAPHVFAVVLGYAYGKTPLSLRRMWLRIEQQRLKRALARERRDRLH